MEDASTNDELACFDCDAEIDRLWPGFFVANDLVALCLTCAIRRGGVYTVAEDRWTVTPVISDLPVEDRSHAGQATFRLDALRTAVNDRLRLGSV